MNAKKNDWRKHWRKNPFLSFFTSLRLTVTLLAFSLALVFFGTLDQVNIGINKAQETYFESFFAVWYYPEEGPLGTRMVLVTHPENEIAKREKVSIEDEALKDFRFLGFVDNTFYSQIRAVFEDSEGKLEPDPELRYHTLQELKTTLAKDEYKNGYAAILPDSTVTRPEDDKGKKDATESEIPEEPELGVVNLDGQLPFTLHGVPVPLPGGYLLGGLLLLNLSASALFRYPLNLRFAGIWFIHGGLALMLVSELVTDLTEEESIMILDEGESSNYSKDFHEDELVLIDESDPVADHVLSIPVVRLDPMPDDIGSRISRFFSSEKPSLPVIDIKETNSTFPFVLSIKKFHKNADFRSPKENEAHHTVRNSSNQELEIVATDQAETFRADEMNFRTAVVELAPAGSPSKPIGEWLVSSYFDFAGYRPQGFEHAGKKYRMEIRRKRHYYPFHVELLDFRFLRYPGTDKPKDFSSDVNLRFPGEPVRKTRIYMNHPLHLQGHVFYQAGFDSTTERQTRLQVVRNPGRILPYVGVTMMGLGLAFQFGLHLFGFARRRERKAMA